MRKVKRLAQSNIPCQATLASDEMAQWTPDVPCSDMADVRVTYHNLRDINSCYHHYITRTAFPNRTIEEAV